MEAKNAFCDARFSVVSYDGSARVESLFEGYFSRKEAHVEFGWALAEGDKIHVAVTDCVVKIERIGQDGYHAEFVKQPNASTFLLKKAEKVFFTTRKILYKSSDNVFELYLSYDLFGKDQSVKIKCNML